MIQRSVRPQRNILTWVKIGLPAGNSFAYPAQRGAFDAQVRRNMVQRDSVENIRMEPDQVEVALLRAFEYEAFNALHGYVEGSLGQFAAKMFPLVRRAVEPQHVVDGDIHNPGRGHRLGVVIAGNLVDKTFEGDDELVFRIEKNVGFLAGFAVDHERAESAVENEPQEAAHGPVLVVVCSFSIFALLPKGPRQVEIFFGQTGKLVQGGSKQGGFGIGHMAGGDVDG